MQASLCKIQGLLKTFLLFSTTEMLDCITEDISFRKKSKKLWCLYLVQIMLHQIKKPKFYSDLVLHRQVFNHPVIGKIQGLFKAFERF